MAAKFAGFPKDFFSFFQELAANNERAWFEANKERYRESIQGSCSAFIEAMAPRLQKISKHITADPRPNGGSMFRIYRDVRFSKDKRPYKENAGIHFRHALGRTAHAPGFYVHLSTKEVFFGGGMWMPEPDALGQIRNAIASKSTAWRKAKTDPTFKKTFDGVDGEALSRPPRGFDPEHPFIEDIKKKSFFAMTNATAKSAQSPAFIDEVEKTFRATRPMMKFLCDAVGAPF
jgi:uncharacterized protein (TIGR02453 family)